MKPKYTYLVLTLFISFFGQLFSQVNLGYQEPPKDIAALIDAPATPSTTISPDGDWLLLMERPNYASIEDVARPELRLAGLRIDPQTNGPSRTVFYTNLQLKSTTSDKYVDIEGLPEKLRANNIMWSPDGSKFALTQTTDQGIELWVVERAAAKAKKLSGAVVNAAMRGRPYTWMPDSEHLLCKTVPEGRGEIPTADSKPTGPVIQENNGAAAAVRTYQDLLQNNFDVELFNYFANSQLVKINTSSATTQNFAGAGVVMSFMPSPDGRYVLLTRLERPYSYLVPYYRFPQEVELYDAAGVRMKSLASIPLAESIPKGFGAVRTGPRNFSWRNDAPASVYWVEAMDGGDPKNEVEFRDQLFYLEAPFEGNPKEAISFKLRYGGITWGDDQLAIASEYWWSTRREITSRWDPSNPKDSKKILFDRSREDRYNDPGSFATQRNASGLRVLIRDKTTGSLYLTGVGASSEGNRPFVDKYDLDNGKTERLWRSKAPYYEYPISIMNAEEGIVLTRRESKDEPPNYFLRNLHTGNLDRVTKFQNPYTALKGVTKQLVKYQREDGVQLTGTLYLPAGYDKDRDGRLPVFMWAYPREYKSAKAAGQVSGSPHQFLRVYYGSPIFWITQGYAVFDNFAMPIIGEGEEEPNETFVDQLRMGAEAAVNKLVDMGVADRERLAVGGHSYGAFMTANLLAHTDLFAAGIARSGAYNRTLTPFGFQREERTFWEAPEIYFKMSPFMHADKIKEPLLLIHGEADNNSGTFPLQSKRFYAALKGHGATTRLVMLPHESHGYRARESILHMLYEMNNWVDKHVKNRKEASIVKP